MTVWQWPPEPRISGSALAATIYRQAPGLVSLSVPPILLGQTPSPRDAEFDLDPGWIYNQFTPTITPIAFAGTPNWDARVAVANPAISFTQRKSFVTLQPGNNFATTFDGAYTYPSAISWVANTGKWFWCGGCVGYDFVYDNRKALAVFSDNAGAPSRQDFTFLGTFNQGAGGGLQSICPGVYVGGVSSIVGGTPDTIATVGSHWPYLALYIRPAATRASITVDFWVFNDEGQRFRLGSTTWSSLSATYWVGFYLRSPSIAPATGFQTTIMQADFFRELTGPTPPWARG